MRRGPAVRDTSIDRCGSVARWKEALLWLLVVAVPVGVGCGAYDWNALVATSVTPNGGGTDSTVEHTGTADLPGGSINVQLVGVGFAPTPVTVTAPQLEVDGVPVPTSTTVDPGHQALLEAEADAIGRNIFIHSTFFWQSDPVTIDDGDPITLRYTESDGGTAPTVSRVAFAGTTLADLQDGAPLDDLQTAGPPTVTITLPTPGQSFEAGSTVNISGTAESELNGIEGVLVQLNGIPAGFGTPTAGSYSINVTWPSNAPPQDLEQPVLVRVEAIDTVERSTVTTVSAIATYPDDDDDGIRNDREGLYLTNPFDPDTDDDGLGDGDEVFVHGTTPYKADTDEDGMWDRSEILRGHDPTDEMDRFPSSAYTWDYTFVTAEDPEPPLVTIDSNGDFAIVAIDRAPVNDHVRKVVVPAGGGSPVSSFVLDPATSTPSCAAPISVLAVDIEEDVLAIHASCGGSNVLLVDAGSGLVERIVPNEPLAGGDDLAVFTEFSLGRDDANGIEVLLVGETTTGVEAVLASCPAVGGTCARLVGANDLGGDEISRPGHLGNVPTFLRDTPLSGAPADALFLFDRGSSTPRRVIGTGDPNPNHSTFTLTGVRDYAAGTGGAMVDADISPSRQLLLVRPATPDGFELIRSHPGLAGRDTPDSTSFFGNVHLGSFEDDEFAITISTGDAENGVWASRRTVEPWPDPPESRFAISDRVFTVPSPAPGVTGGRIEDASVSRQGIAGDTMAVRVQFFGGEQALAVLRPGVPETRAAGIASRPQGATSIVAQLRSNPAHSRTLFQPALQALSGLTQDRSTGVAWGSLGFGGSGTGGRILTIDDDATPSVSIVGPTTYDAAPGYEIVNGTHYVTVPTSGGGADALATVDPGTGNATLVGPLLESGVTPFITDVLAHDEDSGEVLTLEYVASGAPWVMHRIDLGTGHTTAIATVPNTTFPWSPAGGDIVGDTFLVTLGAGGGYWAAIDMTGFDPSAPPPVTLPELPHTFLIRAFTGSMPDFTVRDRDGDGLHDYSEDQLGSDADDPDTDGDGLADGAETNNLGTDPLLFDTDGDGLADGEDRVLYLTDPLLFDTDGDGFGDGLEVAQGSDPNDPADTPSGGIAVPAVSAPLLGLGFGLVAGVGIVVARRRARTRGFVAAV